MSSKIEPRHSIALLAPSLFLAERIEDGYSGRVTPNVRKLQSNPTPSHCQTLLVDRVASLGSALSHLPENVACVSIDDIAKSNGSRPEVIGAILGAGAPPLTQPILDKLPNLRVVGIAALSLARHGADTLLARDISVVNATDAYAESVAEFAMALVVLGRRRAFESHELMRGGGWGIQVAGSAAGTYARTLGIAVAKALNLDGPLRALWNRSFRNAKSSNLARPRSLRGSTVGLIGWSANARALRRLLCAAGANVIVYSEHASDDEFAGTIRATLSEALSADIVSLHRGLTPATRHFLGSAELAQLRPGAVLINIARGELIDPEALQNRLRRGDIFACLDTFEIEPLPPNDRLRRLPNVFLTSHIAGGSSDMHAQAAKEVVLKVIRFLDGSNVATVTERRLAAMT